MFSLLMKRSRSFKAICLNIAVCFLLTGAMPPQVFAQTLGAPHAPNFLPLSPSFTPTLVRGIRVYPDNPLKFDFIVDSGDTGLKGEALKKESEKLIRYFLASLTLPEDELWVNLSPYEKDRIIPKELGSTEMGLDMLSQDYLLKQITASLTNPDSDLGKEFWSKVYKQAYEQYGTTNIPVDTFNKVWIMPSKAEVYVQDDKAFIVDSKLKVMLEEDYVALQAKQQVDSREHIVYSKEELPILPAGPQSKRDKFAQADLMSADSLHKSGAHLKNQSLHTTSDIPHPKNALASNIVREVFIPALEKEVNTGKNFSQLRQIYNCIILSYWYKTNLKNSILNKVYSNQHKVKGIDLSSKDMTDKIYAQYLDTFKKGVCNMMKVEYDPYAKKSIPRKYFAGGVSWTVSPIAQYVSTLSGPLPSWTSSNTLNDIHFDIRPNHSSGSSSVSNKERTRKLLDDAVRRPFENKELKQIFDLLDRDHLYPNASQAIYNAVTSRTSMDVYAAKDISDAGEMFVKEFIKEFQAWRANAKPGERFIVHFATGATPWISYRKLADILTTWETPSTQKFLKNAGINVNEKPDMALIEAYSLDAILPQRRADYHAFANKLNNIWDLLGIPSTQRNLLYGDSVMENGKERAMTKEEFDRLLNDIKQNGFQLKKYKTGKLAPGSVQYKFFHDMEEYARSLSQTLIQKGGGHFVVWGVGPSYEGKGHLAFMEEGTPIDQKVFMDEAGFFVQADHAKENGGFAHMAHLGFVTLGFYELLYRKDAKHILLATSSNKRNAIYRAVEKDKAKDFPDFPITALQDRRGVIIASGGADANLRLARHFWHYELIDKWTPEMIRQMFVRLSDDLGKPLLDLTENDFFAIKAQHPIIDRIRQKNLESLKTQGSFDALKEQVARDIEQSIILPSEFAKQLDWKENEKKKVVIINPHLDDDFLAGIAHLLKENMPFISNVDVYYTAKGTTAVDDNYVAQVLAYMRSWDQKKIFSVLKRTGKQVAQEIVPILEKQNLHTDPLDYDVWTQMSVEEKDLRAQALFIDVINGFMDQSTSVESLHEVIDLLEATIAGKPSWGARDVDLLTTIKEAIRVFENRTALMSLGFAFERIHAPMDSTWYGQEGRGTAQEKDIERIQNILEDKEPDLVISNGEGFADYGAHSTTEASVVAALKNLFEKGSLDTQRTKYVTYAGVWDRTKISDDGVFSVIMTPESIEALDREFRQHYPSQSPAPILDPGFGKPTFFSKAVMINGLISRNEIKRILPVYFKNHPALSKEGSVVFNYRLVDINDPLVQKRLDSKAQELEKVRDDLLRSSDFMINGPAPLSGFMAEDPEKFKGLLAQLSLTEEEFLNGIKPVSASSEKEISSSIPLISRTWTKVDLRKDQKNQFFGNITSPERTEYFIKIYSDKSLFEEDKKLFERGKADVIFEKGSLTLEDLKAFSLYPDITEGMAYIILKNISPADVKTRLKEIKRIADKDPLLADREALGDLKRFVDMLYVFSSPGTFFSRQHAKTIDNIASQYSEVLSPKSFTKGQTRALKSSVVRKFFPGFEYEDLQSMLDGVDLRMASVFLKDRFDNVNVWIQARNILNQYGQEGKVDGLAELGRILDSVDSTDSRLRVAAVKAAKKTRLHRAVPLLVKALKDPDRFVRREASNLPSYAIDSRLIKPLLEALNDPDGLVFENALGSLIRTGDEDTIRDLYDLMINQEEEIVLYAFDDHGQDVAYTKDPHYKGYNTDNFKLVSQKEVANPRIASLEKAREALSQRLVEHRKKERVDLNKIHDKRILAFFDLLKQHGLQDNIVIVGGGVRDVLAGKELNDIDIGIVLELTDQERLSMLFNTDQAGVEVYEKAMHILSRLADVLGVDKDRFLPPTAQKEPVIWKNGSVEFDIQYVGPIKVLREGRPSIYLKRYLFDKNRRSVYLSATVPGMLAMGLDGEGNLYGRVTALDYFRKGIVKIVGGGDNFNMGSILRALRLRHEFGLKFLKDDYALMKQTIEKYFSGEIALPPTIVQNVMVKQILRIKETARDWNVAHHELETLGIYALLKKSGIEVKDKNLEALLAKIVNITPGAEDIIMAQEQGTSPDGVFKKRILVVDNRAKNRIVLEEKLQGDYVILQASNGESALRKIEAEGADLIVTDLNMPGKDGRWLAQEVKNKFPDIPIIFYTNNPFDELYDVSPQVKNVMDKEFSSPQDVADEVKKVLPASSAIVEEVRVGTFAYGQWLSRVDEIIKDNNDKKVLILINGNQGSGKTRFVRNELMDKIKAPQASLLEEDAYQLSFAEYQERVNLQTARDLLNEKFDKFNTVIYDGINSFKIFNKIADQLSVCAKQEPFIAVNLSVDKPDPNRLPDVTISYLTVRSSSGIVSKKGASTYEMTASGSSVLVSDIAAKNKLRKMISKYYQGSEKETEARAEWFLPYVHLKDDLLDQVIREGLTKTPFANPSNNFTLNDLEVKALWSSAQTLAKNNVQNVIITTYGGGDFLPKGSLVNGGNTEFEEALEAMIQSYTAQGRITDMTLVVYDYDPTSLRDYPRQLLELISFFENKYPAWNGRIQFRCYYGNIFRSHFWPEMSAPSHITFWRHTWVGDKAYHESPLDFASMNNFAKALERSINRGVLIVKENTEKGPLRFQKIIGDDQATAGQDNLQNADETPSATNDKKISSPARVAPIVFAYNMTLEDAEKWSSDLKNEFWEVPQEMIHMTTLLVRPVFGKLLQEKIGKRLSPDVDKKLEAITTDLIINSGLGEAEFLIHVVQGPQNEKKYIFEMIVDPLQKVLKDDAANWKMIEANHALFDKMGPEGLLRESRKQGVHYINFGEGFDALGSLMKEKGKELGLVLRYENIGQAISPRLWVDLTPFLVASSPAGESDGAGGKKSAGALSYQELVKMYYDNKKSANVIGIESWRDRYGPDGLSQGTNTRPLEPMGDLALKYLLKRTQGSFRVNVLGPGAGYEVGQIYDLIKDFEARGRREAVVIDVVSEKIMSPNFLLRKQFDEILRMISSYIEQEGKDSLDGLKEFMEKVLKGNTFDKFENLSTAKIIHYLGTLPRYYQVMPIELALSLQSKGYEIFDILDKPYIDKQFVGDFMDHNIKEKYRFFYDNVGAFHYLVDEGRGRPALKRIFTLLDKEGIFVSGFVSIGWVDNVFGAEKLSQEYVALLTDKVAVFTRRDSPLHQDLKGRLTEDDKISEGVYYLKPERVEILTEVLKTDKAAPAGTPTGDIAPSPSLGSESQEVSRPGGIDFNRKNLNVEVKGKETESLLGSSSSSGSDSSSNLANPIDLSTFDNIQGFVPVIINITPVQNISQLLGLKEEPHQSPQEVSLVR